MHDTSLITHIAFGFTAALVFGILAKRIGLSPIVGYLVAGIAAGPHTPGFVGDTALAGQLAEIGVILLMFGVGMHFHLKDLLAVRSIAIPGALGQSLLATVCSMGVAMAAGWTWSQGLVLGIAVSVASTVVLLRVLMDNNVLETPSGHVAIGWLIVEDLITVLVLVVLPVVGSSAGGGESTNIWAAVGIAILKLVVLCLATAFAGAKFVPWMLQRVARLRSRELFTLAVLVMSIAVATAAYYAFGASMALGAFLAGMLVGQSKFSHQAGAEILPLRDAFAVLFFVSVGMLFDYRVVIDQPLLVLAVVGIILVVKPLVAFGIVLVCRHTVRTGLTVAAGLAQIGEFSFIVAEVARSSNLLPGEGHAVLVAGAIVSISINPFFFKQLVKLEPWIERHGQWASWLNSRAEKHGRALNRNSQKQTSNAPQAIVVGFGPVGQTLTNLLGEFKIEPLILEMNVDTVSELRGRGVKAMFGDASRREILIEAGIEDARFLVITLPDPTTQMAIIAAANEANPNITVLTRARYLTAQAALKEAGVSVVCFDEAETAAGLGEALLLCMGEPRERINAEVLRIRNDLGSVMRLDA